jgi:hypothetical protein
MKVLSRIETEAVSGGLEVEGSYGGGGGGYYDFGDSGGYGGRGDYAGGYEATTATFVITYPGPSQPTPSVPATNTNGVPVTPSTPPRSESTFIIT